MCQSGQFFENESVVSVAFDFHRKLVAAISARDAEQAADIMHKMLSHGEDSSRKIISR